MVKIDDSPGHWSTGFQVRVAPPLVRYEVVRETGRDSEQNKGVFMSSDDRYIESNTVGRDRPPHQVRNSS